MTTAIVTGGARGIGYAIAESLLARSYNVAILDRAGSAEAAQTLATKFPSRTIVPVQCDVSTLDTLTTGLNEALTGLKTDLPDVIVNNAGVYSLLFSNADRTININLMHVIRSSEFFIKRATDSFRRPSPKPINIIQTASSNGLIPADSDLASVYVASKFGVVGFTRSLKFLGPKFGVRVNCICPAAIDTPINGPYVENSTLEFLSNEGRGGMMPVDMCSRAVLHILDDPTISGEVVTVHPAGGPDGKVEPLDANDQYGYLGKWRADQSTEVDGVLNSLIQSVATGEMAGWSS
eukprot:c6392_g1_i1.p1 GENE.c6392_g1_i1~~c6392_g1_i1.p1  ORF type:complete len:293 (+),score=54.25 c6392_g1_i1:142-1020(+)